MMSTGRGGAGNIRPSNQGDIEQTESSSSVPEIDEKQKKFTTGRGGAGNMLDNIDRDSARIAQGADPQSETMRPVRSSTIGRGGYGNVISDKSSTSFLQKIKKLFE